MRNLLTRLMALLVVTGASIAMGVTRVPDFVKPGFEGAWLASRTVHDPSVQSIPSRPASELAAVHEALLTVYPAVDSVRGNQEELSVAFDLEDPHQLTEAIAAMAGWIFTSQQLADVKIVHFIGTYDTGEPRDFGTAEVHLSRAQWEEIDWESARGKDIREFIPDAVVGDE